MKRKYVVPVISIEHYELTQSIASCATKIGFKNSECVKNDPDAPAGMKDIAHEGYFISLACTEEWVENKNNYDIICYHTNAQAAFTS